MGVQLHSWDTVVQGPCPLEQEERVEEGGLGGPGLLPREDRGCWHFAHKGEQWQGALFALSPFPPHPLQAPLLHFTPNFIQSRPRKTWPPLLPLTPGALSPTLTFPDFLPVGDIAPNAMFYGITDAMFQRYLIYLLKIFIEV